jgi:hypothetical protein
MSPRLDIPARRKRIWQQYQALRPLIFEMLKAQAFLRGSVYELRTRCGKPSCACRRGSRHHRWVLSESRQGRTRLRVVPVAEMEHWRRWAVSYRDFRRRRAQFVKLMRGILEDLDAIERAQRRAPKE